MPTWSYSKRWTLLNLPRHFNRLLHVSLVLPGHACLLRKFALIFHAHTCNQHLQTLEKYWEEFMEEFAIYSHWHRVGKSILWRKTMGQITSITIWYPNPHLGGPGGLAVEGEVCSVMHISVLLHFWRSLVLSTNYIGSPGALLFQ